MNIKLVIGATLVLILVYALMRRFLRNTAASIEHRRMMHDLLTNEKNQVKGKFD